jgi:hypothetical protein
MSSLDFIFDPNKVADRIWPSLDRSSLPSPLSYLASSGLRIGSRSGEWFSVCCPVHNRGAEKKPSLSVNINSGGFKCFSCGVKGGDIIALHRLITKLGFREAVADLGGRFNE